MDDRFHAAPTCVHAGRRGPGGVAVHGRRSCGPRRPGIASAAGPMGSPRLDVVFCSWQCDKQNHGWREGPAVTVLCQSFRSAGRAFTLRLNQLERKKNTASPCCPPAFHSNFGRLSPTTPPELPFSWVNSKVFVKGFHAPPSRSLK